MSNTLVDGYRKWLTDKTRAVSVNRRIVYGIVFDLESRSGFDGEWNSIDDSLKEEIMESWLDIVYTELED